MTSEWIAIPPAANQPQDGLQGYLALPPGGKGPGVVVLQEIFGVNGHIRSIADRLAVAGFMALAPDLFWRMAPRFDVGYGLEDAQAAGKMREGTSLEDGVADIARSLDTLRTHPASVGGRVGVMGFCWGGLLTFLAAARLKPDAAVEFYGRRTEEFIGEAKTIGCPMQFHFGGKDPIISSQAIQTVREGVEGLPHTEFYVYPEVGHGFNCDARSDFHPASAEPAWNRTLGFLKTHLS
ncbi:MAG: dienelactone hydrolase family protein [Deltaproteobacteria bacterium]|nr:dienelactone hydrolase family protein [Deltaproteobacteria bacterium]